jgi:Tfp pilus assembly protein PilF
MPRFTIASLLVLVAASGSCRSSISPEAGLSPAAYRETVTAFYTGLSAMQTTQEVLARHKFDRVVALAPQEPAGWANLGLLLLRQQELDHGAQQLAHAASLAPESAAIQRLQALAESRRGHLPEAAGHWRRALELDPANLEAAYALALDTERQGGAANDAEAAKILGQLLSKHENLAARLEYVRLLAKRGDQAALSAALAPLAEASKAWTPEAQEQVKTVQTTAAQNPRGAAVRVAFLKNFLLREPAYRMALAAVLTPREEVGQPLMRFLRLTNPEPQPSPADTALTFAVSAESGTAAAPWVGAVSLDGEGNPALATAASTGLQIAGVAGSLTCRAITAPGSTDLSADAIALADVTYDYRTDVAIAGPGGFCLLKQNEHGRFPDVTAAAKLPAALLRAPAYGVWAADVDTDGDLDLVLARREGAPVVLRNNGDGTFTPKDLFPGVTNMRGFAWADLDGEGVPDAALLDEGGRVHVFLNQRGGSFKAEPVPAPAQAVALAPSASGNQFTLLVLSRDGALVRLSPKDRGGPWEAQPVTRVDPVPDPPVGRARVLVADLDNNGASDVIVASPTAAKVVLGGPGGAWTPLAASVPLGVQAVADLDGDGRLELIGRLPDGRPGRAVVRGSKPYHWQILRTRSTTVTGDQRINSFGIGGEIEIRSGLHAQRQVIGSPIVHFGLGDATGAEVVRITWPNGALQSEFDAKADTVVKATQRLKGSCPWLFAWDGGRMRFVTDLLWRSPLGLRINAQQTAGVLMTEDWVKVRGDQLKPREGIYDLRVTAELWETHFFDLVSLLVVDHPEGTEVFVDERFAIPPPELAVVTTGPVQAMASVRDDQGHDVSVLAASRDDRFIDFAGRGTYQGITRRHFVEFELPASAPRTGPLWLIAQGWVHPTDSSINVAISQGAHTLPESLSLEAADASGRFRTVQAGLGFPSGKDKTVLIDLSRISTGLSGISTGLKSCATGATEAPCASRRLRLVTNLEIFWDRLGWAVGRPDLTVAPRRLDLTAAELVYRGYSVTEQGSSSIPERPEYVLDGTGQRWRDLEGYYTRYGDVRELLKTADDRYVIMNAGDELRLRFPETAAPANGVVRDFIVAGDGWVKDGDYNTSFSRTVLPLPTHASGRYDTAPGRLEDDPVYRAHARDFAEYHTRYVAPDVLRDALAVPADVAKR